MELLELVLPKKTAQMPPRIQLVSRELQGQKIWQDLESALKLSRFEHTNAACLLMVKWVPSLPLLPFVELW